MLQRGTWKYAETSTEQFQGNTPAGVEKSLYRDNTVGDNEMGRINGCRLQHILSRIHWLAIRTNIHCQMYAQWSAYMGLGSSSAKWKHTFIELS